MKRLFAWLFVLVFAGMYAQVWAGPAEEVLQIAGPRLKALEEGNLDAYMAAFADNAVFQSHRNLPGRPPSPVIRRSGEGEGSC